MEMITIGNYDFIKVEQDNAVIIFSTAKNNLDFNISTHEGLGNLQKLKQWFQVEEIGYLKQIHSNLCFVFDGVVHVGDALVTNKSNTAIGIFNADCVPIMIYDKKNKATAAIHSGWKGTLSKIAYRAIDKMMVEYNSNMEDLIVFIGPHNKGCCYEIGQEVAELFLEDNLYKDLEILSKSKLNLEACIIKQLQYKGVPNANINTLNICTYCNESIPLHSYRKNANSYGRMFSFIYMK